jgi:hypothetical protein
MGGHRLRPIERERRVKWFEETLGFNSHIWRKPNSFRFLNRKFRHGRDKLTIYVAPYRHNKPSTTNDSWNIRIRLSIASILICKHILWYFCGYLHLSWHREVSRRSHFERRWWVGYLWRHLWPNFSRWSTESSSIVLWFEGGNRLRAYERGFREWRNRELHSASNKSGKCSKW